MRRLAMMILLTSELCYQHQAWAEIPKIMLATDEWESYISKTEAGHGKFAEIVTAVFKEIGMETEFVFAPWKRVEAIVQSGEAFAGIPYSCTEERRKLYDCSTPIMNSSYVFFYNKKAHPNGISYTELADLARYHIGGVTGYWYDTLFAKAKLNIEYVTSDEQGITKLYFNRIDLAATDELVGWALIKKLYPQEVAQFAVAGKPFATQYLYLMVSRKYPNAVELTEKFNTTFNRLRKKGALPL